MVGSILRLNRDTTKMYVGTSLTNTFLRQLKTVLRTTRYRSDDLLIMLFQRYNSVVYCNNKLEDVDSCEIEGEEKGLHDC